MRTTRTGTWTSARCPVFVLLAVARSRYALTCGGQGNRDIDGLVRTGMRDSYEARGLDLEDMREQEGLCLSRMSTEIVLAGTDGVRYQVVLDFMSYKGVERTTPAEVPAQMQHARDVLAENALFAATPALRALVKGKPVYGDVVITFRMLLDFEGTRVTDGGDEDPGWDFVDVSTVAGALDVDMGDAPLGEALRGHVMEPVLVAAMQQQVAEMRGDIARLAASAREQDAVLLARYRAVLP